MQNHRNDHYSDQIKASEFELQHEVVDINRVASTGEGGRSFSLAALVVVGDPKKHIIGYGLGKAKETSQAIRKGIDNARKHLVQIPVTNGTIPHDVLGRYKSSRVLLKRAYPGTGIIAGGSARAILTKGGISNILAKSQGSTNAHNMLKATVDALKSLRSLQLIARQRGISVHKVLKG